MGTFDGVIDLVEEDLGGILTAVGGTSTAPFTTFNGWILVIGDFCRCFTVGGEFWGTEVLGIWLIRLDDDIWEVILVFAGALSLPVALLGLIVMLTLRD